MQHRKIAFIGAGNMSVSIIGGLMRGGYPADLVIASNPSRPKLDALATEYGIDTTIDNIQAVSQAEVVVLAVKPQLMQQVCAELVAHTDLSGKLFISIAAGINVARLKQLLGGDFPVIRTMPNKPSAIGKGMTGLFKQTDISKEDAQFATDLMSQVGEIVWVEQQQQIDVITAAAGSSPAYFFLFLEAMQQETMQHGFDRVTSRKIVQQAMLGAAELVCQSPDIELSELRAQVTSKAGTTAKAIEHFQQHGFERLISAAMQAAIKRAKELAAEF